MADRYLNCQHLKCPSPIVKISKVFGEMASGETLAVEADDPAFRSDVEAWAEITGHELVEFADGPVKQAVLRKS